MNTTHLTWNRTGNEWVSLCGRYVIWLQERGPRTDPGNGYGAALVERRYCSSGKPAEWFCRTAPLAEAKAKCSEHARNQVVRQPQ